MKLSTSVVGLIFIVVGGIMLAVLSYCYMNAERSLDSNMSSASTHTRELLHYPQMLSALTMMMGVVLVIAGRK